MVPGLCPTEREVLVPGPGIERLSSALQGGFLMTDHERSPQIRLKGGILDLDRTLLPSLTTHQRLLGLGHPDSVLCFRDLR